MQEIKPTPPICSYEGSDYQKSFWEEGGRAYEDAVEAVALRRLLPKTGNLLLELGAGAGRNTPRYHVYQHVVLVDYSHTQLEQARNFLGSGERFTYVAADVYRLPFVDGLFDGATMIRTLHHMAEPQLALQSIRQTLVKGAVFILEFANKRNIKSVLRYLLRKQTWNPFDMKPIEFASLNFDFHPKAIRNWLKRCDFRVKKQLTVSHFRVNVLKKNIPHKVLVGLDSLLQWTGAFAQYSPSVFVKAEMTGDATEVIPGTFFSCPKCKTPLPKATTSLTCPTCLKEWAFRDGIYDFRS